MQEIGKELLNSTREQFAEQEDPEGEPWAPLSPPTRTRKKRNAGKVLTEPGFLRGNLAIRVGRDEVEIGSPSIYAGTHQFGAEAGALGATSRGSPIPWGDIPARPFLGLSREDEDIVLRIITDYLADSLGWPPSPSCGSSNSFGHIGHPDVYPMGAKPSAMERKSDESASAVPVMVQRPVPKRCPARDRRAANAVPAAYEVGYAA